jgi:hypothetical protein
LFNKNKTTLVAYPAGKSGQYAVPNSVTSIEGGAFSGCSSLTSITIPDGVTSIGHQAFNDCTSLSEIRVNWQNPLNISEYVFYYYFDKSSCRLIVPQGSAEDYGQAPEWRDFIIVEYTEGSGVNDVSDNGAIQIHTVDRTIVVENAQGNPVKIIDANGRIVAYKIAVQSVEQFQAPHAGIYIVLAGKNAQKVLLQ